MTHFVCSFFIFICLNEKMTKDEDNEDIETHTMCVCR